VPGTHRKPHRENRPTSSLDWDLRSSLCGLIPAAAERGRHSILKGFKNVLLNPKGNGLLKGKSHHQILVVAFKRTLPSLGSGWTRTLRPLRSRLYIYVYIYISLYIDLESVLERPSAFRTGNACVLLPQSSRRASLLSGTHCPQAWPIRRTHGRKVRGGECGSRVDVKRFRGGLVVKAHRLLYHSTLGLRVKKKKRFASSGAPRAVCTSRELSPLITT